MHEFIRITKKWLEWLDPENNSAAEIVETIVVDKYLRALPHDAKKVIGQSNPQSASDLVEAIAQYQTMVEMLQPGKKEQGALGHLNRGSNSNQRSGSQVDLGEVGRYRAHVMAMQPGR